MKTKMQYAPVVIPTLNRFKHFKSCLESLEKCTLAEHTNVYIALDYPPSKKYRSGWEKVKNYINKKEQDNLFKKLIIVKRDRNYGMNYPNGNSRTMITDLQIKYDRYIFSEDDNIFSPNFLIYMNKGLEKFKDDNRISFICGYNYPAEFPESYKNNFFISKHSSPWGYGTWFAKEEHCKKYYNLDFLRAIIRDKVSLQRLMKHNPSTVYSIINMLKHNKVFEDSCKGTFSCFEDKYSIFPTISKVKNIGVDGTGVNATSKNNKLRDYFLTQLVDKEHKFEFSDDIFTYEPVHINRYSPPRYIIKESFKKLILRFDLFLLRHFNFVPKSKYI